MTEPPVPLPHGGDDDRGSMVVAALAYAAAGIPVLALHTPGPGGCSCRAGRDCDSPGKHPRLAGGVHRATTRVGLIRVWWRRWPQANIGLATGHVMDVCDIDTPSAARRVRERLHGEKPGAPVVVTGAGWHLWFAPTGHGNRVGLLPGVDWRGVGGYVVAPPSAHHSGRRYRWLHPFTLPLPPCPPGLAVIRPPTVTTPDTASRGGVVVTDRYARAALTAELARIRTAPRPTLAHGVRVPGGRNHALNTAAFNLAQLADALDAAQTKAQLHRAAMDAGLGSVEAYRTIASGWRAGLRHPRTRRPA